MTIRVVIRPISLICLVMLANPLLASATDPPESVVLMERKADAAASREQCYLYSEVLGTLTEIESAQMAADDPKASETLAHMERVVEKMKRAEVQDAKRLKNAELLVERSARQLGDMLHLARGETQAAMQATLAHVNRVHEDLLALVFAK